MFFLSLPLSLSFRCLKRHCIFHKICPKVDYGVLFIVQHGLLLVNLSGFHLLFFVNRSMLIYLVNLLLLFPIFITLVIDFHLNWFCAECGSERACAGGGWCEFDTLELIFKHLCKLELISVYKCFAFSSSSSDATSNCNTPICYAQLNFLTIWPFQIAS